jgi:hypothetical protein
MDVTGIYPTMKIDEDGLRWISIIFSGRKPDKFTKPSHVFLYACRYGVGLLSLQQMLTPVQICFENSWDQSLRSFCRSLEIQVRRMCKIMAPLVDPDLEKTMNAFLANRMLIQDKEIQHPDAFELARLAWRYRKEVNLSYSKGGGDDDERQTYLDS